MADDVDRLGKMEDSKTFEELDKEKSDAAGPSISMTSLTSVNKNIAA